MKILITGANGFIGRQLLLSLKKNKNYKISVLDRKKYSFDDYKKLQKIVQKKDVIIHLAGKTRGEIGELIDANVKTTISLLEAVSKIKGKKPTLIFLSTIGVYFPSTSITEKSKIGPKNYYTFSKMLAEEAIFYYGRKFDISFIILRLSNVYGPTMPPFSHSVLATFIELVKNGKSIEIDGNGMQKRDFIYIDDVIRAIEKAIKLNKKSFFEIFNICSTEGVSIKGLANLIGKAVNANVQINFKKEIETQSWVGANYLKAKNILKWKPEISLKEGICLTYEKKT